MFIEVPLPNPEIVFEGLKCSVALVKFTSLGLSEECPFNRLRPQGSNPVCH